MNREADSKQKIALDTSQSDTKLTVSAISIAGGKKPDKLKQLTAQMTINSHDTAGLSQLPLPYCHLPVLWHQIGRASCRERVC